MATKTLTAATAKKPGRDQKANDSAMLRPLGSSSRKHPTNATAVSTITASLVCAAPFEAMIASLTHDITRFAARFGSTNDLGLLQRQLKDLTQALDEARRTDVWLTPKDVARATGKGLSTVTKECRELLDVVGADKGTGGWKIHWPTYESRMLGAAGRSMRAA